MRKSRLPVLIVLSTFLIIFIFTFFIRRASVTNPQFKFPPLSPQAVAIVGLDVPVSPGERDNLAKTIAVELPRSVSGRLHKWRLLATLETAADLSSSPPLDAPDLSRLKGYTQFLSLGFPIQHASDFSQNLLWRGPVGLSVRQKVSERGFEADGEAHEGELLATLAECGVPASLRITVDGTAFTVDDIVRQTTYDYNDQLVTEFMCVGLAYYLAPAAGFTNRFGQSVKFDDLMLYLTKSPLGDGTCHGTHVCYAIAALLWIDSGRPFLSSAYRTRGHNYLKQAAMRLAATQHRDGAWRLDWSADANSEPPMQSDSDWGDSVCTTGHHLEWMTLDLGLSLDRRRLERAMAFLLENLRNRDISYIRQNYTNVSHALRSLILWQNLSGEQKPKRGVGSLKVNIEPISKISSRELYMH